MMNLSEPIATPVGPTIDSCSVQLGDIVSFPQIGGCIDNGRVKGWSPDHRWLYVAWVGVIDAKQCHHYGDIAGSQFARIYKPVASNRWIDALDWGLADQVGAIAVL